MKDGKHNKPTTWLHHEKLLEAGKKNYLLAQTTTGGTLSFPLSSITREKDSTVLHICVNRMSWRINVYFLATINLV